jgi:SAM-dependent methyltransferase
MLNAGADIEGVDCSEVFVQLGREQWPDMGSRLSICDTVNLHCIPNDSFDWIHSCVVAEHWRPELVPHIFAELRRVVRPGGSFYCAYEGDTGVMADGRDPAAEQTHICLKPAAWWIDHLCRAGWEITSPQFERPLREHPESFFPEYDWAWFVAHRPV